MAGVFISDGMSLRIPAGGLRLAVGADGGVDIPPVQFEVMLDVWPFWLDIAIDQAAAASRARWDLERAASASGIETLEAVPHGELLASECKAGMVAIAAAAFALDNFYAVVKPFVPGGTELQVQVHAAGTPRHRRIAERLRRTFRIGNVGRLRSILQEVFQYRDWAVHPPAEFREPVKHDLFNVGVEWRFVAFRAQNAVSVTRAATSFIQQCLDAPRTDNEALVAWCERHKDRINARWERVGSELAR